MSPVTGQGTALLRLLEEEKQLMAQFLEITKAQTPLIEAEDMESLTKNLELRAQIIAKTDALRPELAGLLKEHAAHKLAADDQAVKDLRQQIGRILAEITEIDNKNHTAARERMNFFQAELRRASDTRKGVGAYIKGAEIFAAEFVDERQ